MTMLLGLQFIISRKGFKQLVFENHTFYLRSKNQSSQLWRCQEYPTRHKCKGTIKYYPDQNLAEVTEDHNHEPDLEKLRRKIQIATERIYPFL